MLYNAAMRSSHVMIRLTKDEAADLERAASTALLAVSTWARVTLLMVARQGVGAGRTAKGRRPRVPRLVSKRGKMALGKTSPIPDDQVILGAVLDAAGVPVLADVPMGRCSRHKRVGCVKDPECVRETTVFRA